MRASPGSWLGISNGSLYLRRNNSTRLWLLDTDSLREIGQILLPTTCSSGVICSDSKSFRLVVVDTSGNLSITQLNDSFNLVDGSQIKFRLVDTSFEMFGDKAKTEGQTTLTYIKSHLCRQAADLQVGREIAILLSKSGKIYYAGKGSKIGLQDTGSTWMELVLPESIVAISVSPDSNNVALRSGAGHVWIAGSSLLDVGSNGTQSMPKKSSSNNKLRRLITANRKKCTSVSVSAAALAYVTENGRVFINGRHTMQCLPETGQVVGLEHIHIVSVSLGKTHAVAISRHGHLYTWGFNNLYQCGRAEPLIGGGGTSTDGGSTSSNETMATFNLCAPTEHMWFKDVPSLCTACGLCTAHGKNCQSASSSSGTPLKNAATAAGSATVVSQCVSGESGCLRCGVCRRCGEKGTGGHSTTDRDKDSDSSDRSHKMLLSPSRVALRSVADMKVSSVSCGNYHTLLLTADGQVWTFGSNCHGQLGVGDCRRRIGPQKVETPEMKQIVQIAAGANHCILRSADGYALTFGSFRSGQLGRSCAESNANALPGFVESVNPELGVVARWVGATATTSIVQLSKQIVSAEALKGGDILANQNYMIIFPKRAKAPVVQPPLESQYLVLNLKTKTFSCIKTDSEVCCEEMRWCLDPSYQLLWVHMVKEDKVHALTNWYSDQTDYRNSDISFIQNHSYWLPTLDSEITCSTNFLGLTYFAQIFVAFTITDDEKMKVGPAYYHLTESTKVLKNHRIGKHEYKKNVKQTVSSSPI